MIADNTIPPVEQFHQMIWKAANKAYAKMPRGLTGVDLDDLYAEGLLAYCKAARIFQPGRAQFITIFYTALWQRLAKVVNTAHRKQLSPLSTDDDGEPTDYAVEDKSGPSQYEMSPDLFYNKLSKPAWMFARAVLDPPKQLINECRGCRATTKTYRNHVLKFIGLRGRAAEKVLCEVAGAIGKNYDYSRLPRI